MRLCNLLILLAACSCAAVMAADHGPGHEGHGHGGHGHEGHGTTSEAPADHPAAEAEEAKPKPYSLTTCIVSGEPLDAMGDEKTVSLTYEGQEVKFCCKPCIKDFNKDPKSYIGKMAAQVKAAEQPAADGDAKAQPAKPDHGHKHDDHGHQH